MDFAAESLRPNGEAIDLTDGFTISSFQVFTGRPERSDEGYIDDFEVYDVVPEDAGQ